MQRENQALDPEELVRLPDLEILTRTIVRGFEVGLHESARLGTSMEFSHYRPYVQGDDIRSVDWKFFGRSDRLYLKQARQESNLACTLLLDCSGSMSYASRGVSKFDYGRMLAGSFALLMTRQHDRVGLVAYAEDILTQIPPLANRRQFRRILVELEGLEATGQTSTGAALDRLGESTPSRGMIVVISDFLFPIEDVLGQLRSLKALRHDVILFSLADPAERDFPFDRPLTLADPEGEDRLSILPEAVRQQYLKNRAEHFERIRQECLNSEITFHEIVTDEPLDRALYAFVSRRRASLTTRRSASRPGSARPGV